MTMHSANGDNVLGPVCAMASGRKLMRIGWLFWKFASGAGRRGEICTEKLVRESCIVSACSETTRGDNLPFLPVASEAIRFAGTGSDQG